MNLILRQLTLLILALLTLQACKQQSSDSTKVNTPAQTNLPAFIMATNLQPGNMQAYITVDGDNANRILVAINNGLISYTIPNLSVGIHEFTIEFFYLDAQFSAEPILLASKNQRIDLQAGNNNMLVFNNADYDLAHNDTDGVANIRELDLGTDPFLNTEQPSDINPPILSSNYLSFSNPDPTGTNFEISWSPATDDITDNRFLEYKIFSSAANNMIDVDSTILFGAPYPGANTPWSKDLTRQSVSASPTSPRYWTVLVRDTSVDGTSTAIGTENRNVSAYRASLPHGFGRLDRSFPEDPAATSEGYLPSLGTSESDETAQAMAFLPGSDTTFFVSGQILDNRLNPAQPSLAIWQINAGIMQLMYGLQSNLGFDFSQSTAYDIQFAPDLTFIVGGVSKQKMRLWRFFTAFDGLDATFSTGSVTYPITGSSDSIVHATTIGPNGNYWSVGHHLDPLALQTMTLWKVTLDGSIDPAFASGNGYISHFNGSCGGPISTGKDIIFDNNNKILIAGECGGSMTVWRYHIDGTLDTAFNGSGFVSHPASAAEAIALDTNGRILVTGEAENSIGNLDMGLWRYLDDGSLDSSFANAGIALHNNAAGGDSNDRGFAIVLDRNERILIAGRSATNSATNSAASNGSISYDMAVWRYTVDGILDADFNNGLGSIAHHNAAGGNGSDEAFDAKMDSLDRLVVVGNSEGPSQKHIVTWRLD